MRGELADAIDWATVEFVCAVRLSLQSDTDVLDWGREDSVGYTSEGAGHEILTV